MVSPAHYDERLRRIKRYAAVLPLPAQLENTSPERTAAIADQRCYTYGDLVQAMHDRAEEYRHAGLGCGSVAGLQSPNTWDFLVAHAALAQLGAVAATLHQPLTERECRTLLEFLGASHWVRDGRLTLIAARPTPNDIPDVAPPPGVDWPLAIFFTSGTQSLVPKPCLHSHQSLLGNARTVALDAGMTPDDRFISASPFTHLFGILSCHLAWVLGAPQILVERFRPDDFLHAAKRHRATVAFLVPTHLRDLLGYLKQNPGESQDLKLREVRVAGAAVSPDLAKRTDHYLGARLVNHWGMSEIGAGTYTYWQDPAHVATDSIGRPGTGADIMLMNSNGHMVSHPGETAEILFRGPSLFYGYYNNLEATNDALYQDHQGQWWLKTGDLASWDSQGRLHYCGRLKDFINRGGMKVDALEVEYAVMRMAGIRLAALVAIPDSRLGERAILVVETEPGSHVTLDHVKEHLSRMDIAKFKWPERLEVWDRLPTTPTGKLAKARIREALHPIGEDTSGPRIPH